MSFPNRHASSQPASQQPYNLYRASSMLSLSQGQPNKDVTPKKHRPSQKVHNETVSIEPAIIHEPNAAISNDVNRTCPVISPYGCPINVYIQAVVTLIPASNSLLIIITSGSDSYPIQELGCWMEPEAHPSWRPRRTESTSSTSYSP